MTTREWIRDTRVSGTTKQSCIQAISNRLTTNRLLSGKLISSKLLSSKLLSPLKQTYRRIGRLPEIFYRKILAGRVLFVDGPADADTIVVYVPGQTEPVYTEFHDGIAKFLARSGYRVIRFDFTPLKNEKQVILDDSHIDIFCEQLAKKARKAHRSSKIKRARKTILVGKSFGGAIASKVMDKIPASGCVVIGYPFLNPHTKWDRLGHLGSLRKRLVIIQGTDDLYGSKAIANKIDLAQSVEIDWIKNADHGFSNTLSPNQDQQIYDELLVTIGDACKRILKAA